MLFLDNNISIGKNKYDNDKLFDLAEEHHTWFHIANESSAHLWLSRSVETMSKKDLYLTALQLKKKSKFEKVNAIEVIYAQKSQLLKTDIVGQIDIVGKSKIIRV